MTDHYPYYDCCDHCDGCLAQDRHRFPCGKCQPRVGEQP